MKQGWGLSTGVLIALLFPTVNIAAEEGDYKGSTAPFLYVAVTEQAEIIKGDDGAYTLVVKKEDIVHVLEVSEEPFQLANSISADEIVKTWETGAGNFGAGIAMKGTILGANEKLASINITEISKTEEGIRYIFFLDGNASIDPKYVGTLQSVTAINYCCHPEGGSAEWLWGKH